MTTSKHSFRTTPRAARGATIVAAVTIALALATGARAATFLDDVDRGKAAVAASGVASLDGATARAAAVQSTVAKDGKASPAFTIGAILAALNLDLESTPATHQAGDRAVIEQQVRDLLRPRPRARSATAPSACSAAATTRARSKRRCAWSSRTGAAAP